MVIPIKKINGKISFIAVLTRVNNMVNKIYYGATL
jgi:hypothetical protein